MPFDVVLPNEWHPPAKPERHPTIYDAHWRLDFGVAVVPRLTYRETDEDSRDGIVGWPIEVDIAFDEYEVRYLAKSVRVRSFGGEVTGTDLRTIRVAELVRAGARHGIFVKLDRDDPPASLHSWFGSNDRELWASGPIHEMIRKDGPKPWVLEKVSFEYKVALVSSQPPAKAVQEMFGLPPRTAANWIAKARSEGLLKLPRLLGADGKPLSRYVQQEPEPPAPHPDIPGVMIIHPPFRKAGDDE